MTRPLKIRLAPVLLVALLAMGGARAAAQTPLDETLDEHAAKRLDRMEKAMKEMRAIVFQGRETGAPVVVQPAETQGQIAALGDKINDINTTLARLNGELEVIKHDLDQSRQEAADLRAANAALREQVAALQKTLQPPPPPPPAAQAAPAAPPGPDPAAAAFAEARAAFEAGDNATAEAGFRDYVDRYGDGPGGPEARYYFARTLMARQAWPEAATAEIGAIRGWPHTRWAPDAVVDLSKSLIALGKPADACQTLGELARRYPKAPPATLRTARALRLQAQCQ